MDISSVDAWMVRAGRGGYGVEDFETKSCVAIGWEALGNLTVFNSRDDLRNHIEIAYEGSRSVHGTHLSQVAPFRLDMKVGDSVITYNPVTREYLVGKINGDYEYKPGVVQGLPNLRQVRWTGKVSRDALSVSSRNTLGSTLAVFKIGQSVWEEINRILIGELLPPEKGTGTEEKEMDDIWESVIEKSREFIKDLVAKLSWDSMQELVAGILRAMGYKTRVSPPGADRGKDVVASPDGLSLESPRIRVEVKHRSGQMGSVQIRSFIGGLRSNFCGLYVSSGGFTKEAKYEAERSAVPVTLLDIDDLVSLLIQHYDNLDTETRALVPLRRIYWPVK